MTDNPYEPPLAPAPTRLDSSWVVYRWYIIILGAVLLVTIPIATYRDITIIGVDRIPMIVGRLVVFSVLGVGLIRRNIWAARLCYSVALFFVAGLVFLAYHRSVESLPGYPYSIVISIAYSLLSTIPITNFHTSNKRLKFDKASDQEDSSTEAETPHDQD